jgi:flavin-dependent dehydrogenase
MEQHPMPMENIKFYSHSTGTLLVEDPGSGRHFGRSIARICTRFLLEKAREMGVTFLMGRPVTGYDGEGPSAMLGDGETVDADVILVADGELVLLYTSLPLCVERRWQTERS